MFEEKLFAVLGLSKFGFQVAANLFEQGEHVIAVDKNEKTIQKISGSVTKAVCSDLLDYDTLEYLGILKVDTIIIGLRSSFEVTVLLVSYIKSHEKNQVKQIIVHVDSHEKARVLKLMGVDMIVFPDNDMAGRIANKLTNQNLVELVSISHEIDLIEMICPGSFIDKSLLELDIRKKYDISVIGVVRSNNDKTILAPPTNMKFHDKDKLILLGNKEKMKAFRETYTS